LGEIERVHVENIGYPSTWHVLVPLVRYRWKGPQTLY